MPPIPVCESFGHMSPMYYNLKLNLFSFFPVSIKMNEVKVKEKNWTVSSFTVPFEDLGSITHFMFAKT